jgi:hypothetical protein
MNIITKTLWLSSLMLALWFVTGCSSVTPVSNSAHPAVSVEHVQVLYQEPARPYEVISLVSHEGGTRFATVPGMVQKCRELAAKAGADAVIITSTYGQTFSTAAKAAGKAIRWKQ